MGVELDFSWSVFRSYAFYSSILIFKLISLSFLKLALQLRKRIVLNKEGMRNHARVKVYDEKIERTVRAQDDDIKQIVPFCTLGLIYCFTHPSPAYAETIFMIFTGARFCYSFVYIIHIVRQPARALAWSVGTILNMYMCFKIFFYFM